MAVLKGKGAMSGVNLVVRVFDNAKTKDGKSQYADVQVDARDRRGPEQTNLHLVSQRQENGSYNNGAPYSVGQIEAIAKTAGDNITPINNVDGEQIGTTYGVKADLMYARDGKGLIINTKSLEASEFAVDEKTLDNQFASMATASEVAKEARAAKAAEAKAPEAEQSNELTSADLGVDEPSVG